MRQKQPLLVVLLSLCALIGLSRAQTPAENGAQCLGGQLDAPIRVEVFSDFQCPSCRNLYLETMRLVLKDYCSIDKVCLIYHEFPLAMHTYAREAARYSQAAQKLGRTQYVAVVEALYTDQAQWSQNGKFEATLSKALSAVDLAKLKKLLQDPAINEAIDREVMLGQMRKVESTPTFFVSAIGKEQRVVGGVPYQVLKDFFDRIVK
jgi:protein-disulfide isomerase